MDAGATGWPWAGARTLALKAECYETPDWAAEAILDAEGMCGRVIDPCCGRGVLAEAAAERGHRVDACDLYDWGYGASPVDFLTWHLPADGDDGAAQWTCLMTPPYSQAVTFVRHALAQGAAKVLMYQRLAIWASHRRRAFWDACPPARIHVCESPADCWRIDIPPAARLGDSRAPHAWFVFERRQPPGTLIARLARPPAGADGAA